MGTEQDRIPLRCNFRDYPDLDDITSMQYGNALERLQKFLTLDVGKINTIEQLLYQSFVLDHSLRVVLLAKGESKTVFFGRNKHTGQAIDTTLPNGNSLYVGETKLNTTIISTPSDEGNTTTHKKEYIVQIPAIGYPEITEEHNSNMLSTFAMDSQHSYYPLSESSDDSAIQGYAKVLHKAIQDVVSILQPPTEIPSAFTTE